ncbi:uncharacterized protein LOC112574818 [Pomacea canaliculata]|uniref:uncharacterized protein LOC112574818 n=1 Tax=Pomacea canaliculata TaxID=400727 RepID=UPI000D72F3C8|nr:uncharacterized protein LOC112574818 [Pomacea canaliculata]
MAIQWLRCGHHVYVVSTWTGSRAACSMLYHLLLQDIASKRHTAGVSTGQPRLLQYDFEFDEDVVQAVNDLSRAAKENLLYIIADETIPGYGTKSNFHNFSNNLLTKVPDLHLWAANCYHEVAPDGWQVEHLTRPLRSPPTVVREVEQDDEITKLRRVHPYSERGVPDHTDGPPVTRLYHRGQGHSGDWPVDCVTCGRELASLLHSLRVNSTDNVKTTSTTFTHTSGGARPACVQWRHVLLLYWRVLSDSSHMMTALREAGIPVRVMKDDDIDDVATARSDVVWVAEGDRVRGLERKVVVCLGSVDDVDARLQVISRCTSQLVIYQTQDES